MRTIVSFLFVMMLSVPVLYSQTQQKNRLIVLTDIENEPDDSESMVRLLLYSNKIDIEGIIATTSCWFRNRVAPESIKATVLAYEKVYPNLVKHEKWFPGPARAVVESKAGFASVWYGRSW